MHHNSKHLRRVKSNTTPFPSYLLADAFGAPVDRPNHPTSPINQLKVSKRKHVSHYNYTVQCQQQQQQDNPRPTSSNSIENPVRCTSWQIVYNKQSCFLPTLLLSCFMLFPLVIIIFMLWLHTGGTALSRVVSRTPTVRTFLCCSSCCPLHLLSR